MQATVRPRVCQAASTCTSRPPVQHVQTASRTGCADTFNALEASADADWSMLTLATFKHKCLLPIREHDTQGVTAKHFIVDLGSTSTDGRAPI